LLWTALYAVHRHSPASRSQQEAWRERPQHARWKSSRACPEGSLTPCGVDVDSGALDSDPSIKHGACTVCFSLVVWRIPPKHEAQKWCQCSGGHEDKSESAGAGSTSAALLRFLDDFNPECEGEVFPLRSTKFWPKLLDVPRAEKFDVESMTSRNRSDIRPISIVVPDDLCKNKIVPFEYAQA
jgi:hypothetical protein